MASPTPHKDAAWYIQAAPFVFALAAWVLPITTLGVVGSLGGRELGLAVAAPMALLCGALACTGVVLGLFAKGRPVWCALGVVVGLAYLLGGLIAMVLR